MPSSLHLNGELFSNYKHHTILKGLIGISPGGAITFISQLYTGSVSDREIVVRNGFLDLPFKVTRAKKRPGWAGPGQPRPAWAGPDRTWPAWAGPGQPRPVKI